MIKYYQLLMRTIGAEEVWRENIGEEIVDMSIKDGSLFVNGKFLR